MKVSLNWITEFTDVKLTVDELVAKIGAQLGEVEEVINLGERYEGVVVAKVVSCEKHPNADKLNVCLIDDGKAVQGVKRNSEGLVQVVCGAPNVRRGLTVAWIPPGAIVPSTFDNEQFTIEARELRGVVSNGMLASGKELALNDDHDGILVIDKHASPGTLLSEVYKLDDYIIDIENKMFTHRPDCFGQLGIAREVAGIQGLKFTSPEWYQKTLDAFDVKADKKLALKVVNELPELVLRFMAIPVSGVKVAKSPVMIQSFLSRVGIKPINNVVDITNFVMTLTAQPLHAFDYDKVAAQDNAESASIVIRHPRKGEKIALLNGKTIEPRAEAIMIASNQRLLAVGGIMGGVDTEVDNDTTNIILECANFDMYSIRRTSMANGLFTDAVTRFNKGQSPLQNDKVLAYAVAWVQKLADGAVAGELRDVKKTLPKQATISISRDFVNDRLGLGLSLAAIAKILKNVEFEVTEKEGTLSVTAPFWRTDILIAEDIVEEVGRLVGFDKLPLDLPLRSLTPVSVNQLMLTKSKIREVLRRAGANESLTYSFVHGNLFEKVGQDAALAYQLTNALSPELQYYRVSLLPSLLERVYPNVRAGYSEFAIFEVNKTHDKNSVHEDGLPIEHERVALVFTADKKGSSKYHGSPYYQAKKYLDQLLTTLGFNNVVYEATSKTQSNRTEEQLLAPFSPGRTAYVKSSEGVVLGVVGELKTSVKRNLKLPDFTAGFELKVQLLEEYGGRPAYKQLSRYPSTQQDISFKLSSDISYAQLTSVAEEVLQSAKKEHGYEYYLEPTDIYQDKEVKNSKHITLRITLTHHDRTLVTEEVNTLLGAIAKAAHDSLKASRL